VKCVDDGRKREDRKRIGRNWVLIEKVTSNGALPDEGELCIGQVPGRRCYGSAFQSCITAASRTDGLRFPIIRSTRYLQLRQARVTGAPPPPMNDKRGVNHSL
jgi:hypothetical protein